MYNVNATNLVAHSTQDLTHYMQFTMTLSLEAYILVILCSFITYRILSSFYALFLSLVLSRLSMLFDHPSIFSSFHAF